MAEHSALEGERVQKVLSRAGIASRRKAEDLIRSGRVTVNGEVCTLGVRVDPERDWVKVDGRTVLRPRAHHTILLNKPSGYLTTVSDPEGRKTVLDLVPPRFRRGLFPVGRLDLQTEGVLLLTTDGELAEKVTHPRHGCTKTYRVKVRGIPADSVLTRLRAGIVLDRKRTAPIELAAWRQARTRGKRQLTNNSWWTVVLGEGRNRQIREMFDRVGHPVLKLKRIAVGPISATGLPVGACRELEAEEVAALRGSMGKRPALTASQRSPRKRKPPRGATARGKSRTPTEDGAARGGKPRSGRSSSSGPSSATSSSGKTGAKKAGAKRYRGGKAKGTTNRAGGSRGAGPRGAGSKGSSADGSRPRRGPSSGRPKKKPPR